MSVPERPAGNPGVNGVEIVALGRDCRNRLQMASWYWEVLFMPNKTSQSAGLIRPVNESMFVEGSKAKLEAVLSGRLMEGKLASGTDTKSVDVIVWEFINNCPKAQL